MKLRCSVCKKHLDTNNFHKNRRDLRGFSCQCKKCRKPSKNRNEYAKQWAKDNTDKVIESNKTWYVRNKELLRKMRKAWRLANPEKVLAHQRVKSAIVRGYLIRLPCHICDNPKSEAHHEDYSKPYEVFWLCHRHHSLRHSELKTGIEEIYE